MCRHVCSMARITNEEEMTPRVRALMLSMILRDAEEYTEEIAENIYQCALCEYCKEWCQGGWDFPSAIRAARADVVKKGMVPEVVKKVKGSILQANNPYGKKEPDSKLKEIVLQNTNSSRTLILFGSEISYLSPEIGVAMISLMNKAGIKFMTLEKEINGAYELYNLGYQKEAKERAALLIEAINKSACKEVIILSDSLHYLLTAGLDNMGLKIE